MTLLETMHTYFQGEKVEALVFILPMGLLSLAFAGWLLSEEAAGFLRGLAIPFVIMGLVMSVVGGVVGYRTPGQVATLEVRLQSEPVQARADEQARMQKVNGAWPVYLALWGAMGLVGLVLRFALRADFAHGLGIALVFFSGVGLLVDGFAERRARPYTQALAGPAPEVPAAP